MAYIDPLVAHRFGVVDPYCSINEIDLRISQAAHMFDLMLAHATGKHCNIDELHSMMLATYALLGMTGPHIDALQRVIGDGVPPVNPSP